MSGNLPSLVLPGVGVLRAGEIVRVQLSGHWNLLFEGFVESVNEAAGTFVFSDVVCYRVTWDGHFPTLTEHGVHERVTIHGNRVTDIFRPPFNGEVDVLPDIEVVELN